MGVGGAACRCGVLICGGGMWILEKRAAVVLCLCEVEQLGVLSAD